MSNDFINPFYDIGPEVRDQADDPVYFDQEINQWSTTHQICVEPCDPGVGTPATTGTAALYGKCLNAYAYAPILDEFGAPIVIDLADPKPYVVTGRYSAIKIVTTAIDEDYQISIAGW